MSLPTPPAPRLPAKRRSPKPSKLTKEVADSLCETIERFSRVGVACKVAGISPDALEHWLKWGEQFPDSEVGRFRARFTQAKLAGIKRRLASIDKAGLKDWRAHAWLAEREFPEELAAPARVVHSGTVELGVAGIIEQIAAERRAGEPRVIEGEARVLPGPDALEEDGSDADSLQHE